MQCIGNALATLSTLGTQHTARIWMFVLGYVVLEEAATNYCVRNQFKKVVVEAGIRSEASSFGLHSMRRGGATAAVNKGASDHAVMKQMRVSTTATVRRYAIFK